MTTGNSNPLNPGYWTVSGNRVLRLAKALATPKRISKRHLLIALSSRPSVSSKVISRIPIHIPTPSGYLCTNDIDLPPIWNAADLSRTLRQLFRSELQRQKDKLQNSYLGTHHLLLMLACAGIHGVDLDYRLIFDEVEIELSSEVSVNDNHQNHAKRSNKSVDTNGDQPTH